MINIQTIQKAREFGANAHFGHVRKYSGEDYFTSHCEVVATTVLEYCSDYDTLTEMVAAALLHDTIEDTNTTPDEIKNVFGDVIASYVIGLTHASSPGDGNRAFRKRKDAEFLSRQSKEVQMIKLADIMSNSQDICSQDPQGFAPRYMKEMGYLIPLLSKTVGTKLNRDVEEQHTKLIREFDIDLAKVSS